MNYKKFFVPGLTIAIIVMTATTIFIALKPSVNIAVLTAPTDSQLTVDGTIAKAGKLFLAPGTHSIELKRSGFSSVKKTVSTKESQSIVLKIVLNPSNSEGLDYLTKHSDQELLREQLGGEKVTEGTNTQSATYPIIARLPHTGIGFSINYGVSAKFPDDPVKLALYIDSSDDTAKVRAYNWIRYLGYNPDAYEIINKSPGDNG